MRDSPDTPFSLFPTIERSFLFSFFKTGESFPVRAAMLFHPKSIAKARTGVRAPRLIAALAESFCLLYCDFSTRTLNLLQFREGTMKRFLLTIIFAALLASCASGPSPRTDSGSGTAKQCSDTPRDAISTLLRGITEFSLSLLRAVLPEGISLYGVFGNNDAQRGKEVVRQISANPEVSGESGSCTCSLLSIADTADPNEKIVVVKREVVVGDELHTYKRAFRARFEALGNCILAIDPVDSRWERI